MSITSVLVLTTTAVIISFLRKGRGLMILASSAVLVYWLEPNVNNPSVNYWLPTLTLALAVLSWAVTSSPENRSLKRNWPAFAILFGVSLLFSVNRYIGFDWLFDPNAPRPQFVVAGYVLLLAVMVILLLTQKIKNFQRVYLAIACVGVLSVLVLIKSPELAGVARKIATFAAGVSEEYKPFYIYWLGYSYVAFRLVQTYLDKRAGRLPQMALDEYVNFVIFFPSFSAGPIDRAERFLQGLRSQERLSSEELLEAGKRFFLGLFKKFVLADGLALISLDAFSARIPSPAWAWGLLYVYAFRLLFDFSGYTDIAIGLAKLMRVQLPENFDTPYLKSNLITFWNSWHMSLTQWFRAYVFNPLARALRSRRKPVAPFLIIVIGQILTMLLIGMWHGINVNYILWGLYHAFGLIVCNRWLEWTRALREKLKKTRWINFGLKALGIALTFNFVAIGWLFFALRSPELVLAFMKRLVGAL